MSDQPASQPVLFETLQTASGHRFGRATLNAPASLNSLSLEMVDLLNPQLAAWAADPHIAGVILDATGEKAFCAGGDVVDLVKAIRALPPGQVPPWLLPSSSANMSWTCSSTPTPSLSCAGAMAS
ncbi:enoyl-CoA hydratase/isomerase family protein [Ottowia sp. VDI28]|uniref:enoyl-CoA hydratase/isomerase family protein n=1 Tax=Ottowia sp. VDI28 TaxID=3133968 RepID=UPI003C2B5BDC